MPTGEYILIVEDAASMRQTMRGILEAAGHRVGEAADGDAALAALDSYPIHLMLLDLSMPKMRGEDVLAAVRKRSRVPIIVVSGEEDRNAKVEALSNGADDYITKPFDVAELVARVRAVLRRANPGGNHDELGDFRIDRNRAQIWHKTNAIRLTAMENRLVGLLFDYAGQIVLFDDITRELWQRDDEQSRATLRVLIWRLRQKLEDNPDQPKRLVTEENLGYRLKL
ncbi:response regulator transcription factor [Ferrovibrio sp.]|uniref:response regulator transcription factor n=1 Tax=Ferrovibrio sp. TaxID=1917215 RepID=UPI00262D4548|nr:response regulator transcription factor [Ferrovibrio sp.]